MPPKRTRAFLTLWTLAVIAASSAFIVYLGLRVRSISLGYELGSAHSRLARLREVERVYELELSSHQTPERVDLVARTLLGMSEPSADRILPAGDEPAPSGSATATATAPSSGTGSTP